MAEAVLHRFQTYSAVVWTETAAKRKPKHGLLAINLASVPGRQLVNFPTAQSLER